MSLEMAFPLEEQKASVNREVEKARHRELGKHEVSNDCAVSKQDLSRCPLRGGSGTGHPNILRVKTAAWRRRTRAATVDVLLRLRSTCQSRCRLLKAECLLPLAADKDGLWRLEPRLRRTEAPQTTAIQAREIGKMYQRSHGCRKLRNADDVSSIFASVDA